MPELDVLDPLLSWMDLVSHQFVILALTRLELGGHGLSPYK